MLCGRRSGEVGGAVGPILLTGSSGYLGSAIAAALSDTHEVRGFDCRPGPHTGFVADLGAAAELRRALDGVDAVIHLAALHVPQLQTTADIEFRRVNVDATLRLLDLAHAAGVRRFVYGSTTSLYGHALALPDRAAWITEAVVPQPRDIYDETKLAAERACQAAAGAMHVVILRIARCFPEPLPQLVLQRAYRGIDRADVVTAHRCALAHAGTTAALFNVCAPSPFQIEDCAALYADAGVVIRRRVPRLAAWCERHGQPLPRRIDRVYVGAAAEAGLGFRAEIDVERLLA